MSAAPIPSMIASPIINSPTDVLIEAINEPTANKIAPRIN
jgi:hypothetical protein